MLFRGKRASFCENITEHMDTFWGQNGGVLVLKGMASAFETWRHTRRNQISSFGETDESIQIGGGVSSVDY